METIQNRYARKGASAMTQFTMLSSLRSCQEATAATAVEAYSCPSSSMNTAAYSVMGAILLASIFILFAVRLQSILVGSIMIFAVMISIIMGFALILVFPWRSRLKEPPNIRA